MAYFKRQGGSSVGEFISTAVGFKGRRNILAWLVAGGAAYYLYVRPERQRAEEQQLAREIVRQLELERQRQQEADGQQ